VEALTTEEQHAVGQAVLRLQAEFRDRIDAGTIAQVVADSVKRLADGATTTRWIPVLAERMAWDRMRDLTRSNVD
jgi:hypothetical protein